jgi:hypothetical protein
MITFDTFTMRLAPATLMTRKAITAFQRGRRSSSAITTRATTIVPTVLPNVVTPRSTSLAVLLA